MLYEIDMLIRSRVIPRGATIRVYREGTLVDERQSVSISGQPTARGQQLTITFSLDVQQTVTVVAEVEVDGRVYSAQQVVVVDDPSNYQDGVVIGLGKWEIELPAGRLVLENKQTVIDDLQWGGGVYSRSCENVRLEPYLLTSIADYYLTYQLFSLNGSILSALDDLRKWTDRINMRFRLDSLKLTDGDYLSMLRLGGDKFNGEGIQTDFTFSAADGSIRYFWLVCAKWCLIRMKALEEGLMSFEYTGADVMAVVDLTQYLEAEASALEMEISKIPDLKKKLANNGNLDGSGASRLGNQAPGATGMSYGPVTGTGSFLTRR